MFRYLFGLALLWLCVSCSHTHFVRQSGGYTAMDSLQTATDADMEQRINPYKSQIEQEMQKVVCVSAQPLTKQQPESTMGNWIADAVAKKAADYTGLGIDFCVLNYGGLRVGSLPQGNLTKGHIFEVLPFDNTVVVVEMPGNALNDLFAHIVFKKGWPVSAAVRMEIADERAQNVRIDHQPIDSARIYRIATNDYMANGGDNCTFFVGKKQVLTGKFLRDAVIEFGSELQAAGKVIESQLEGRIRYQ